MFFRLERLAASSDSKLHLHFVDSLILNSHEAYIVRYVACTVVYDYSKGETKFILLVYETSFVVRPF